MSEFILGGRAGSAEQRIALEGTGVARPLLRAVCKAARPAAAPHLYGCEAGGIKSAILVAATLISQRHLKSEEGFRMSQNEDVVELFCGDVVMWTANETSLHLKCVTKFGDPVELNAEEIIVLCETLQRMAKRLE